MDRYIKYILIITFWGSNIIAQNIMSISNSSANALSSTTLEISIDNNDDFVAFQTDIVLPSEVQYIAETAALSARANGHTLSASLIDDNTLRIIVFSLSQELFIGNSGSVLTFEISIGSNPGNYLLELVNPIISNVSSQNILSSSLNGTITIIAPDISTSATFLDYGEVPLTDSKILNLTIYNNGNSALNVSDIQTDNQYFVILGDDNFTLSSGLNRMISVQFISEIKGTYNNKLTISSDDPDNSLLVIDLNCVAFAVNELHMQSQSCRSGYPTSISFNVNNMEEFSAFQFDIILPNEFTYINNELLLSDRKTDHIISASTLNDNTVRVVAYSPSNESFTGNDGELMTIGLLPDGIGGNYNVNFDNVVISDISAENIVSDFYPSYINIIAPDINGNSYQNMGEVSVLDNITQNFRISNTGNDLLSITSFNSPQSYFWNETTLPVQIPSGSYHDFQLKFENSTKGNYTDRFVIISNDPDENPFYLNVEAVSFAPNYLNVEDLEAFVGEQVTIQLNMDNYEEIVALETDIIVPNFLEYIPNSARLTSRKQDHSISIGEIEPNKFKLIAFSLTQKPFLGNSGAVIELDFNVNSVSSGMYTIELENSILGGANSENLLKESFPGNITIKNQLQLNIKAFLEGPFMNNSMTASLTQIPNNQPFSEMPWNYSGTEIISDIPDDMVDWVLIELRTDPDSPSDIRQAALLLETGEIKDLDGISSLNFNVEAGNYYIVVYHRNHLSVMSSSSIQFE